MSVLIPRTVPLLNSAAERKDAYVPRHKVRIASPRGVGNSPRFLPHSPPRFAPRNPPPFTHFRADNPKNLRPFTLFRFVPLCSALFRQKIYSSTSQPAALPRKM